MTINPASLNKAIIYGAASVALYYLLFLYADKTIEWATLTREGQKIYFLMPVIIPFVFSLVHGAFTAYFWDALGMKPAAQNNGK